MYSHWNIQDSFCSDTFLRKRKQYNEANFTNDIVIFKPNPIFGDYLICVQPKNNFKKLWFILNETIWIESRNLQ